MTMLEVEPAKARDITALGARELAALIARGELSSAEVVEAHIGRIKQVNARLNAVVIERYDAARAEARAADAARARGTPLGPLHGVPITVKETLDLKDTPASFGLASQGGRRASHTEVHVARMLETGAIVLGKTNIAQLLLYFESDNPVYGRTNNPWNAERTPGGSSGGEAAIIASGGSPLGLGTDLGGSVRVPAHFSGIASFKPTAGRTPDMGRYSVPIGQRAIASQVGVLARHVGDVALGVEIINGAPGQGGEPPVPLGDQQTVDLSRLRVGYYTDDGTFAAAPAVRRAVREAADALRSRGAHVAAWSPPDVGHALGLYLGILMADGGRGMREMLGRDKRDPRIAMILALAQRSRPTLGALGALLRLAGQRGLAGPLGNFGHRDTAHYWRLVEAQIEYQQRFAQALDRDEGGPFDLILCPAGALPAFRHGASRDLMTAGGYTVLYNLLGYPAGVVPFTRVREDEAIGRAPSRDLIERAALETERGSAGLPIGVQVVARPWRDHLALAAMRAIEEVARTRADFPARPAV